MGWYIEAISPTISRDIGLMNSATRSVISHTLTPQPTLCQRMVGVGQAVQITYNLHAVQVYTRPFLYPHTPGSILCSIEKAMLKKFRCGKSSLRDANGQLVLKSKIYSPSKTFLLHLKTRECDALDTESEWESCDAKYWHPRHYNLRDVGYQSKKDISRVLKRSGVRGRGGTGEGNYWTLGFRTWQYESVVWSSDMLLPVPTILWRRSSQCLHSSLLAATPVTDLGFLRLISLLLQPERWGIICARYVRVLSDPDFWSHIFDLRGRKRATGAARYPAPLSIACVYVDLPPLLFPVTFCGCRSLHRWPIIFM